MSELPRSRFAAYEAHAQDVIDQNAAQQEADDASALRQQTIEARATSPEVTALNDFAELQIYGSKGRTYVHPETGATIADANHVIPGHLEDMRHSPAYGKTEKERNGKADAYASEIDRLISDEGLELCQAKLLQDLRQDDEAKVNQMSANLMTGGQEKNPLQARKKAKATYAKLDANRLKMIKEGGAFTRDEYDQLMQGNDIYDDAGNRRDTDSRGELTQDVLDEAYGINANYDRARHTQALTEAEQHYIEESATSRNGHLGRVGEGRLRRLMGFVSDGVRSKRSSERAQVLSEARDAYRHAWMERNVAAFDVNSDLGKQLVAEGKNAPDAVHAELLRMQLDELNNMEDGILNEQEVQANNGRMNRLQNWIARQWESGGRVKKAAMIAVPAAAIGVTGGVAAVAVGGGLAATTVLGLASAYGGRKAGHGIAGSASRHAATTKEGRDRLHRRATERTTEFEQARDAHINNRSNTDPLFVDHTDDIEIGTAQQTEENRRRRRIGGAVGAVTAAAFFGGTVATHDLLSSGHNVATSASNHASGPAVPHTNNIHQMQALAGNHATGAGHNAAATINPNQYPWTVAHGMTPGHETATLHNAIHAWNANHSGSAYHLAHNVGAQHTTQLYNGHHALNVAQQKAFNVFMEGLK